MRNNFVIAKNYLLCDVTRPTVFHSWFCCCLAVLTEISALHCIMMWISIKDYVYVCVRERRECWGKVHFHNSPKWTCIRFHKKQTGLEKLCVNNSSYNNNVNNGHPHLGSKYGHTGAGTGSIYIHVYGAILSVTFVFFAGHKMTTTATRTTGTTTTAARWMPIQSERKLEKSTKT